MSTIQPRTSTVVIFQGDHLDRLRFLEQQYEAAVASEKSGPPRLQSEVPDSHRLVEEHKALKSEAEESATKVVLRALGRKAWRNLVAKHPPRLDVKSDVSVGVNESTFKDALVPASIIEPELSEDDLDTMSDGDFDRLYYAAFALNRMPGSLPKDLSLPMSPKSDETSS